MNFLIKRKKLKNETTELPPPTCTKKKEIHE